LEEWADYIACLSKLQKALQVSDELHTVTWIPEAAQIANKLSLCLSSQLPSGVHQKTLTIYETILNQLDLNTYNRQLNIWLPVLFPVFSFAALSIKPMVISIFRVVIENTVNLKVVSKPLLLSLLPGLEDENSEVFNDVLAVLEKFKTKLNDDSVFWQAIFMSIIGNPEKRLGALRWCTRKMPVFKSTQQVSGSENSPNSSESGLSSEAKACLSPEVGMIVHAFSVAIAAENDIVVIRGYFDLLLTHIPLSSDVFDTTISHKDKELLLMACVKVTLKKDMSLNRRVWNYLLGPETEDADRSKYFEQFALKHLTNGLLKMVEGGIKQKMELFKISLHLVMDKWEISNSITGDLFSPLLSVCFDFKTNPDLVLSAQAFFDSIESSYIWKEVINMLLDNENLELVQFILKTFNFTDDEMIAIHVPLAVLVLLSTPANEARIDILSNLIKLLPKLGDISSDSQVSESTDDVLKKIKNFYKGNINDTNIEPPFDFANLSNLLVSFAEKLYLENLTSEFSYSTCGILCNLLEIVPNKNWEDEKLVDGILNIPIDENNFLPVLGITKILRYLKFPSHHKSLKALKNILSNLWFSLTSNNPAYFQVETVKAIYDLQTVFLRYEIEAGVFELLLNLPVLQRTRAFSAIWIHSSLISDGDLILLKPLQLLIDELDGQHSALIKEFVRNVVKNGFANRLLKLLTDPLLEFDFFESTTTEITKSDDLGQFAYHMKALLNIIKSNPKLLKEVFSNESVVMDSTSKISIIESNGWKLSSYKLLILSMILKFLSLKVPSDVLEDGTTGHEFNECVEVSIDIYSHLITGNEADFGNKFNRLLTIVSYYVELDYTSETLELVQANFLNCIFKFFEMAEDAKVNLDLLYANDGADYPLLVTLIMTGIDKAETSVLLSNWTSLLTRSIHIYRESIFHVILPFNDALTRKLTILLQRCLNKRFDNELTDIETSINYLLSCVEDLLCISHGYLITSNIRAISKANTNNEGGFFGNVIQGVFQIESPALRSSKKNNMYSIYVSFQDAVKVCFELWEWADHKPEAKLKSLNDRSLAFVANKIKFKARKLLETLLELEMQNVIEKLIQLDVSNTTNVKLLNILEGGRSQVTLPSIFNSIVLRCSPQSVDESKRPALKLEVSDKQLSTFLVAYFNSIDTDTIIDIWDITMQFFRDVLSYPTQFSSVLPDCVKLAKILSMKVNTSKLADQKKNKRELSDTFVKLLNAMVSNSTTNLTPDLSREELDKEVLNDLNLEILEALKFVMDDFELAVPDTEKATSAINTTVFNLLVPQIKGKKIENISSNTVSIIKLIGQTYPTKSWKSTVSDILTNNGFFEQSVMKISDWDDIMKIYITEEKEKMAEMIARVTPALVSSTSNIFIWNEGSEVEIKVNILKRLTYLILIQPKDFFLTILEDLITRIKQSLNNPTPAKYRSAILVLLRAITLKFNEIHLLPYWTFITYELISIFEIILTKNVRDLATLAHEDTELILHGCKLLDQLLAFGYDEFNLNEWLFVTSRPDIMDGENKDTVFSIIDEISKQYDFTYAKDVPIRPEHPHHNLVPILHGIKTINNITELRLFFDSLRLINYERTFGLYKPDYDGFALDVLNDILI
jgi:hypothetical protein